MSCFNIYNVKQCLNPFIMTSPFADVTTTNDVIISTFSSFFCFCSHPSSPACDNSSFFYSKRLSTESRSRVFSGSNQGGWRTSGYVTESDSAHANGFWDTCSSDPSSAPREPVHPWVGPMKEVKFSLTVNI